MTETTTKFTMTDLSVFERPGTAVSTRDGRAGCRVTLADGSWLSVQWGGCMYGSNYNHDFAGDVPDAEEAEIAVSLDSDLVRWVDGDTVQGWCSMERVQGILDKLIAGTLIVDGVADDGQVSR